MRPDDLSRVNRAFFHVNAVVSIGLLVVGVVDLVASGQWRVVPLPGRLFRRPT